MAKPMITAPENEMSSIAPIIGFDKALMIISSRVTPIMNTNPTPATTWNEMLSLYTPVKNRFIHSPVSSGKSQKMRETPYR